MNLSSFSFHLSEAAFNNLHDLPVETLRPVQPGRYIIYIDPNDGSVNAKNSASGTVDYKTNSAPANSADTTILFNNVFDAIGSTGGMIFLRDGTYTINNVVSPGVFNQRAVHTILQGGGRDTTTIRFDPTATPVNLIICQCSFSIDGITLDGSYTAKQILQQIQGHYLRISNCTIKPAHEIALYTGITLQGMHIINNIFDATPDTFDQFSANLSSTKGLFMVIEGNYFDKTCGVPEGSSLTSACCTNAVIRGNIINRKKGNLIWGISLENWGNNYKNVIIESNVLINGSIGVGGVQQGGGIQTIQTYDGIIITNNCMTGGTIGLYDQGLSPLRGVVVANNSIYDSWNDGIHCEATGHTIIANNVIREANQSLSSSTFNGGCINIYDFASNVDVFGNTCVTTDTRTNASAYCIRFGISNVNIRVFNNRFYNTTSHSIVFGPFGGIPPPSNILVYDNYGYVTRNSGATTFNGNANDISFKVSHGLDRTPSIVTITTNQNTHAYISAIDSKTFTVTFASPPASWHNVVIYWHAENMAVA